MTASAVSSSSVPSKSESQVKYEPPRLDEVGDVVALTRGTAADDTADMKTSKYF
jgi:hypothetical protein